MSYVVGRGRTINLKARFVVSEGGVEYDPTGGTLPELTISYNGVPQFGPLQYLDGAGPILRTDVGLYNYDFVVPGNASLGTWTAEWDGGLTTEEQEFTVVELDETPNPAADLLKRPVLSASMRESPLYQVLGVGFTDTVFLIGHADGLPLNDPYRVSSIQEAVNIMGADSSSPLLRGMLELYYSGCRDIVLVAAAPMDEYSDSLPDRLKPRTAWGSKTFYQQYKERLDVTYTLLKEWDLADIVVPLEAPFYDAGGVDFLGQLANYCQDFFDLSGKVVLGLIGTRGVLSDQMVKDLLADARPELIGEEGKFVAVIVGDGVINNKEVPVSYGASVVASVAGMLSQMPLSRGIPYIPVPNVIDHTGKELTDSQVQSLALKKLNVVTKTARGRRGVSYSSVIATDNTLGSNGSDYWSLLQMRLITKIIEKIRTLGRAYIGTVGFADFKSATEKYMLDLVRSEQIRDFTLRVERDQIDPGRASVDISVRPYFGIREVYAAIEVGPSIAVGTVR